MKIIVLLCCVLLVGCSSMPKDTYVREGELIVNTPWGPSSIKGGVIATGKAAIEAAVEATRLGQPLETQKPK